MYIYIYILFTDSKKRHAAASLNIMKTSYNVLK